MASQIPLHHFKSAASEAMASESLRLAMNKAKGGFIDKRLQALANLPEFEQMKQIGVEIKNHTLSHLDQYLDQLEQQVLASGGHVHWASTPDQANQAIVDICQQVKARKITKGKSMVAEETGLNQALESAGFEVIETDLGEYIIQSAGETPSHIIAPAVHKTRAQIIDLFKTSHTQFDPQRDLDSIASIVGEAREVLRNHFVSADVGITGANFLIAQTGSSVLITNEGNGDLTASLPDTHIIITSIEKVVPTLDDASLLIRLLDRSATGQSITNYTSFFNGPKRAQDQDGPSNFHLVLLDNGRSDLLGGEFQDMLRCIRCGACLNHCPVYGAIGGHAYGWVYPGPMGAVLTPLMQGLKRHKDLPNACTLNGRCEEVCPMKIELPRMLRQHRMHEFEQKLISARGRVLLKTWAWLACKPRLYHIIITPLMSILSKLSLTGRFKRFPFASAWTAQRDLPAPEGGSFIAQVQKQKKS